MVIETSPRVRSVPMPVPDKRSITFGDVLNPSTDPNLECGLLHGGIFKSECWNIVTDPEAYQLNKYGVLPLPVSPPAPNAPQTGAELAVSGQFTPEQALLKPGQVGQPTQDEINAAIAAGTYSPGGRTPINTGIPNPLPDIANLTKLLLVGGAVIGGVILLSSFTRR